VIIGGEDHKTGQEDDGADRFSRLEAWGRERFPAMQEVQFRWSGQVMEPIDGLAFIGHNPLDEDNVFIATGDSGMGMTHGTIAGILITDLIIGRDNPWKTLYDPARKTLKAGIEFAKEASTWWASIPTGLRRAMCYLTTRSRPEAVRCSAAALKKSRCTSMKMVASTKSRQCVRI
jgi:hypothetical protein